MSARPYMYVGALVASAFMLSAPSFAATVSVAAGPAGGTAVALTTADFERLGNCGAGKSVVNDGCSVIAKSNPLAVDAYGRFDPPSQKYWIDSADIDELQWTIAPQTSFTSLTFALTDAYDQADSHFTMSYELDGVWTQIWEITERQENGNLFWLTVDFDNAVTSASFKFSTKVGKGYDGYGINALTIKPTEYTNIPPVPVPSAALLLLSGTALLAGLRRKRKAA